MKGFSGKHPRTNLFGDTSISPNDLLSKCHCGGPLHGCFAKLCPLQVERD